MTPTIAAKWEPWGDPNTVRTSVSDVEFRASHIPGAWVVCSPSVGYGETPDDALNRLLDRFTRAKEEETR